MILAAQIGTENGVEWWQVVASLALVAVAVGLSVWRDVGVERSILWATLRAAIQLVAVGVLLGGIFESSLADAWAWLWVGAMVGIAAYVTGGRVAWLKPLRWIALVAIGLATGAALLLVFALRVFPLEPVTIVVTAGITIGNTLPGTVLGARQLDDYLRDRGGEIEALHALGFYQRGSSRFMVPQVAGTALIPQIERTKVVGLIALPGAMTGLLLAGVDPIDAVLVQLIIMYVILGSVAVSVLAVVTLGSRLAFTDDMRLRQLTAG